jgi:hypothetical protein
LVFPGFYSCLSFPCPLPQGELSIFTFTKENKNSHSLPDEPQFLKLLTYF